MVSAHFTPGYSFFLDPDISELMHECWYIEHNRNKGQPEGDFLLYLLNAGAFLLNPLFFSISTSLSLRDSWPLTMSTITPDCTSEHQTRTTQMRSPGPQATDIKATVIISPQPFSFLNFLCLGNYVCMCTQSGEGNGTPLQYSCLENLMDRGAWKAVVHGVAKSQTWLSDFTFIFHFHALEKEMATHSSVLAWRIPGTGEPGGLPSMGSRRVGHDWSDLAAAVYSVISDFLWRHSL